MEENEVLGSSAPVVVVVVVVVIISEVTNVINLCKKVPNTHFKKSM